VAKQSKSEANKSRSEFAQLKDEKQLSLPKEFLLFITENKKWWLLPIFGVLLLLGILVVLGSTGAAPFIYPLF
jgi:uncharacterized membrane protein SpoIIM required for sporulation